MGKTKQIKKNPSKTADRLMATRIPLARKDQKLEEIQNFLFERMNDLETINYIYVVDKSKKLIGVFSIKEIFRQPKDSKVEDVMETNLIKCRASTKQGKIATLALKNNLKAIPVVDKEERFLGAVTSDVILNVLHEEHVEDFLLAGGISRFDESIKSLATAKVSTMVKARLPWLLFGLFGGIVAARVIGLFENILESQILLALFIPVIVYISDAVATQTETLIVRGVAIDTKLPLKKYFLREIKIGILIALILGGILAATSFFWWHNFSLSLVLELTLFFSIMLSVIIAMLIPLILQKLRKDPAFGSGPFATIITDILSITIYFLIAEFLFGIL